ncbi:Protein kinase-like domain containing protein [Elaphomyces granulatus]
MEDFSRKSRELRNLQLLQERSQGSLSSKYTVQLLDSFAHQGSNGLHQCLCLYHLFKESPKLETILRMSKQLLEAIKFMHDAGIGHGDISGGNVAFTCSHLSTATKGALFEVLGIPKTEDLVRHDGKPLEKSLPKHLVESAKWGFLQGAEPVKLAQPGPVRVLETIFAEPFDHRVDLWLAGCVIYSFVFGTIPFVSPGGDNSLVAQMSSLLGKLGKKWQPNYRGMMRYLPSSRITPSQALRLLKRTSGLNYGVAPNTWDYG